MSDSYGDPQQNSRNFETRKGGFRGNRGSGNRESGGFRIRLSDNEMKAARAIQDAFNLRSTVAVLGFAIRTLGQMLEEGKLDGLIQEFKSQNPKDFAAGSKRFNSDSQRVNTKPNPFARPEKPLSDESVSENKESGDELPNNNEQKGETNDQELNSQEDPNISKDTNEETNE